METGHAAKARCDRRRSGGRATGLLGCWAGLELGAQRGGGTRGLRCAAPRGGLSTAPGAPLPPSPLPGLRAAAGRAAAEPGHALEQPHHLVVLVVQHARQEERGLLRAARLEAAARPALAVHRHVPQSVRAGLAPRPGPAGRRRPVQPRGVRVVAQLVDSLHKLALGVVVLLRGAGRTARSAAPGATPPTSALHRWRRRGPRGRPAPDHRGMRCSPGLSPTPSVWAQGLSGLSGWAQGRLAPPLPDTPHSCLAPTLDREKVGGNTEPSPGSVPLSWRRLSSEMEARPPPSGKPKASLSLHGATWGGEGGGNGRDSVLWVPKSTALRSS